MRHSNRSNQLTFSIRTTLLCVTFVACWLGAISTGNAVMMDLMVCVSMWLLFLTLPLAIWDSNYERRPFWGGFFAVGIANVLLFSSSLFLGGFNWNSPPPSSPATFQTVGSPGYPPASLSPIAAPAQSQTRYIAILRILAIFASPVLGGMVVYYTARKRNRISSAISRDNNADEPQF